MLASGVADRDFDHRSGPANDFKIVICWSSAKHVVLRNKIKDWLAQNLDIVVRVDRAVFTYTVV